MHNRNQHSLQATCQALTGLVEKCMLINKIVRRVVFYIYGNSSCLFACSTSAYNRSFHGFCGLSLFVSHVSMNDIASGCERSESQAISKASNLDFILLASSGQFCFFFFIFLHLSHLLPDCNITVVSCPALS